MVKVEPIRVGPYPFPMSSSDIRIKDFSEVEQPYTKEQAMLEAERCLLCGNPICIDACPVQMDVRGMCEAIVRGDFKTAFYRIRETNSLLGVTARCCPQLVELCEDACVMRWQGQPVSIGMLQRFVSDWEKNSINLPEISVGKDSGKKVSIVGSGPAGIAAADLLRKYGHFVTIYEEYLTPGGTVWYAIPDYHVPPDVLLYEIESVKKKGVEIKTGVKVGRDIAFSELVSDSDAVIIATGSKDVEKLDISGVDLKGVFDGYKFLETVYGNGVNEYLKNPIYNLGNDIIVIGGGDTALDSARTARRLTQGNINVVYRRTENEMPANPLMIDEAEEEGINFTYLTAPHSFIGVNGKLTEIKLYRMKLGEPDESGRKRPVPITGQDFTMKCDSVIIAVGRGPNSFLQKKIGLNMGKKNSIKINDHHLTSIPKVFAAGDITTGESLVVKAMGQGREAALRVHEFLMGTEKDHISLYEKYYTDRTTSSYYQKMLSGKI